MTPPNRYKHYRFPTEIISHGVWLYYRFCLSYRDVEELFFARGIAVTYETIRKWCRKFGQRYANQLRYRRPRPGDKWHLDEVFLTIHGKRHYLWRAVDQDGNILDILVQRRRHEAAAKKFFPQATERLEVRPARIDHRSAEELWGGQARALAGRGASPTSLLEQPRGKFAPTHPPTGAARAGVQGTGPRPAFPGCLWSDRATLLPATASVVCPRLPSRNATQIRHLAGTHHPPHRCITVKTGGRHAPSCLTIILAGNKLTKPEFADGACRAIGERTTVAVAGHVGGMHPGHQPAIEPPEADQTLIT
jgi:hypothetical protein